MLSGATIQTALALALALSAVADVSPVGLAFTGRTTWDQAAGTVTFESDGAMPDTREGFYWQVPVSVRRIQIGAGVTVRGAFRIPAREKENPLYIVGKDRETSVLYGTDQERWTTVNAVPEKEKWKYGAISVMGEAVVYVADLTSRNPRSYNVSGYADKAVLHVSRCNLVDSRKGDNNNSDGFIGASGSTIADSLISTSDDGVKIYSDMTLANVTIEQHRNGAPIQFGWGGEPGHARAHIVNLTITGVDQQQLYNMAPFTWEGGTAGTRDVTIEGLKVTIGGKLYDERAKAWRPMGLFELKPPGCTLNLTAVGAEVNGLDMGIRNTMGKIIVNGLDLGGIGKGVDGVRHLHP